VPERPAKRERQARRVLTHAAPRRALITTLLLLVVVIVSGLVAVSPFALNLLSPNATDWTQLSLIGQTYGAASALLAVIALLGVAVSLLMQAREARASRQYTLRSIHTELLRMAMDDPLYRRAWGPFFASDDHDAQREFMYVNLIIANYQMSYELKTYSERLLRDSAYHLLSGEAGQRFWAAGRERRLHTSSSRRERRFHQILDEEYQRALRSPATAPRAEPANPSPDPPSDAPRDLHSRASNAHPTRPARGARWLIAVAAGAAGAVAILRALGRARARGKRTNGARPRQRS